MSNKGFFCNTETWRVSFSDKPFDIYCFQGRFEVPRDLGVLANSTTLLLLQILFVYLRDSNGVITGDISAEIKILIPKLLLNCCILVPKNICPFGSYL